VDFGASGGEEGGKEVVSGEEIGGEILEGGF